MNFKAKLKEFFRDRYGGDSLNTLISILSLVSFIAAVVVEAAARSTAGRFIGAVLYIVAFAALALSTFRIFSKNLTARRAEFEWYRTKVLVPFARWRAEMKTRRAQSATHRFFKCPRCGQTVRVPKGKGKIKIKCPKCCKTFVRKS